MGAGGWICTFHSVIHLHLECTSWEDCQVSLIPFYGLSPTVRSLCLTSTLFKVFDLVCSFPLLKDLALVHLLDKCDGDRWITPSTSPKLTRSLDVRVIGEIHTAAHWLLDLPGGLRFTKIVLSCLNGDFGSARDSVLKYSGTLESFNIYYSKPTNSSSSFCDRLLSYPPPVDMGRSERTLLDLSMATKLKSLTFQCTGPGVRWVITTLQTVKSKNLQWITLRPDTTTSMNMTKGMIHQEWLDLNHLLVHFWTLCLICPQVVYGLQVGGKNIRDHVPSLSLELTRRGLANLVETHPPHGVRMVW